MKHKATAPNKSLILLPYSDRHYLSVAQTMLDMIDR